MNPVEPLHFRPKVEIVVAYCSLNCRKRLHITRYLQEIGVVSMMIMSDFGLKTENKKLSCRTEAARWFVSLNISLSHSRSL